MTTLRFNMGLRACGLDPAEAPVVLHSTTLPVLRRRLPDLAAQRPDRFGACRGVRSPAAEAILRRRLIIAASPGRTPVRIADSLDAEAIARQTNETLRLHIITHGLNRQ